MPIDPKILSVQPGADRANAGEADPRSMLSFDLATPDTAPDEWQRAAARRVSEAVGLPDPDGRVWKGKPFATGAEYLSFMRGMLKSGDVWEYAATEELKAFEAADDAGRPRSPAPRSAWRTAPPRRSAARFPRATVSPTARRAEGRSGECWPPTPACGPTGRRRAVQSEQTAISERSGACAKERRTPTKGARRLARAPPRTGSGRGAPREAAAGQLWAAWLSVTPRFRPRPEIATGLFRDGTIRGEDIADFQRLMKRAGAVAGWPGFRAIPPPARSEHARRRRHRLYQRRRDAAPQRGETDRHADDPSTRPFSARTRD
jgi:hypothetical protein